MNFLRTAKACIHKALHSINNGTGNSQLTMLRANRCQIAKGSKGLRLIEKWFNYSRQYRQRRRVSKMVNNAIFQQRKSHRDAKLVRAHQCRKGQLDPKPNLWRQVPVKAAAVQEPQPTTSQASQHNHLPEILLPTRKL